MPTEVGTVPLPFPPDNKLILMLAVEQGVDEVDADFKLLVLIAQAGQAEIVIHDIATTVGIFAVSARDLAIGVTKHAVQRRLARVSRRELRQFGQVESEVALGAHVTLRTGIGAPALVEAEMSRASAGVSRSSAQPISPTTEL